MSLADWNPAKDLLHARTVPNRPNGPRRTYYPSVLGLHPKTGELIRVHPYAANRACWECLAAFAETPEGLCQSCYCPF